MNRWSLVVSLGVLALAIQSCGSSPAACEVVTGWSQGSSTGCALCASTNCGAESRAVNDAANACRSQYAAALACGNCTCYNNAITVATCRGPADTYISCMANKCNSACK